jgi:glutamate-ammonia-ligase adenylyltransferase
MRGFFETMPPAVDVDAAARLTEGFAALGPAARTLAESAAGAAVLACLGGNAPYLAGLALREPDTLAAILAHGPDLVVDEVLAALRALPPETGRAALASALRQAKRRAALAIALADIAGLWQLPRITEALSDLAVASLSVAIAHLLRDLHAARRIALPFPREPARGCGFTALALGKLGAGELNYSSDIDLVLLYDPESPCYSGEAQSLMARLARDLVTLISQRDADGYVFRVDLRLRPDPAATPAVVALPTALRYYESQGRTWERAAFSKARPVAGDLALGWRFLEAIRPFIWRRHLDFAAIEDIHAMKRQIDARQANGLAGFDVKLGRGGIREIEFLVQTLSLVWGGQETRLRVPATLDALPALAAAGHLPAAAAADLAADYISLRQVEHRLQMVDDRQTHALPGTEAGLAAFAIFLGRPDFVADFTALRERVHGHFLGFFDAGTDPGQSIALDPGPPGEVAPGFAAHLTDLGFRDPRHIAERLRDWASGTMAALRSERARGLAEALTPSLLTALSATPEPDKAFAHFDAVLARQRAGVQLLSLFQRNPALLTRVAAVLGAAPALAEHLETDAQALEALLAPSARFDAPKPALRARLAEVKELEEAVAVTRRFVRQEEFHISVATLEGRLDADEAGCLRTRLAAAALAALLPRVLARHRARFGRLEGAAFAIVALGKTGAEEMMAGSDLDLLLIYDHAAMDPAPTQYFVRLSHALMAALTARGPEGPLYQVDMRLRPSGNQGPVAVSRAAFARYQAADAWTWERLALTRARVMAATPGFAPIVRREIETALRRQVAPETIRADTLAMRDRLAAERPPVGPYDIKHLPGGLLELGFIPEALQLIHGRAHPGCLRPNLGKSLAALARARVLSRDEARALTAAGRFWRTVQGMNRITGLPERAIAPPAAMLRPLLAALSLGGEPDLRARMDETGRIVRRAFARHIGGPEHPTGVDP